MAEERQFVDILRSLANLDNPEVVRHTVADLAILPEDLAEAFPRLEPSEQLSLLNQIDAGVAAQVMVALPTETARSLVDELSDDTVAHYLDILPMDDAIDLSEELSPERFEALLEVIPAEDAMEIRRLMAFPEDSVGRLVTEKFFEVAPDMTVADILTLIRRAPEDQYETVNDIYVLDEGRHLIGVCSLRKAIRSDLHATAREIMREEVITSRAYDSAEDAARTMSRYGFYALPVLDSRGRMIGIFTGDDAQTILREAESEDALKMGGVVGDVEAYLSLNVWQIVKRRLPWLMILFFTEFLTGSVLRRYMQIHSQAGLGANDHLRLLNDLSLFVPLLIGAGGNAGSQVTTTITRALAIGEIRAGDAARVWLKELGVASCIGATLGLCGFFRAFLPYIGWDQTWRFSFVVGLALPLIIIWAASVGSLLPIAAKRLGIDPAVMSAPFIATFVDATGLIIYFETANAVLNAGLGR